MSLVMGKCCFRSLTSKRGFFCRAHAAFSSPFAFFSALAFAASISKQPTGDSVPFPIPLPAGMHGAYFHGLVAAGVEGTAGGRSMTFGGWPSMEKSLLPFFVVSMWEHSDEAFSIGMGRSCVEVFSGRLFYNLSGIHDADLVAHMPATTPRSWVMRMTAVPILVLSLSINSRIWLDGYVQGGGGRLAIHRIWRCRRAPWRS